MAEFNDLGTITLDRLSRGWKVSVTVHKPGEDRPQPLGMPDHFPIYRHARSSAERLQFALGFRLVDNDGSAGA